MIRKKSILKVKCPIFLPFAVLVYAATLPPAAATDQDVKATFWSKLSTVCGKAFEGKLISTDPQDAGLAAQKLIMHVRECSDTEIKIPFHVSDNRSRTWIIALEDGAITLKHDHRHEDGSLDKVTQYGGRAIAAGTNVRQEFPADHFTIEMFKRQGLEVSVNNVWAVEIDDTTFIYELSRPNRLFRVAFDLSIPVTPPPAPWGHK